MSERQIQSAIVEALRLALAPPALAFSVPNQRGGGSRVATALEKRAGLLPGVADLIVAWPVEPAPARGPAGAAVLALEVKTSTGRLSPAQRAFAEAARAVGWRWACVRSVDDAIAAAADAGAPLRMRRTQPSRHKDED